MLELDALKPVKLEREHVLARLARFSVPHQVLDEDGTSKTKLGGDGFGDVCRDAEFAFTEPDDVELAVTPHQVLQEILHRMDGMEKLEPI